MGKKSNAIIITALITLAAAFALRIAYVPISEDRYNKILCYYLARAATLDMDTSEKKICALQDFVHINIHPMSDYENRLDTKAIDKLVSGVGWCDQQARVFMQLAGAIGINTRLLFLISANGTSPHSVAEAQLPNGRWVMVDPLFNLELRNRDGALAGWQDINEDPGIITRNDKVRLRAKYETRWDDPGFIFAFYNTPRCVVEKKGVSVDLLKFVPLLWLRYIDKYIADRYIDQLRKKVKDGLELKMIRARTYHLIGYYKESDLLYREIISTSKNQYLVYQAEYYEAMLLKNQKLFNQSIGFVAETISRHKNNPYNIYLVGLMSHALEKSGNAAEAFKKRGQIGYMLQAI